jgi:HAD superfamily phosphoserine phosphatase-like hydrolase
MTKYAFDLDGTITKVETLPLIAEALGLSDEMKILTDLTLEGKIPFEKSFKLRYLVLRNVPIKKIVEIMDAVELDENISNFIREHKNQCAIITGNLDFWIAPIVAKLGCESYSSRGTCNENGVPVLEHILRKAEVIRQLKKDSEKVIAIGESFNDVPMFEEADISVAYGGVHKPVSMAISIADYVVFDGGALCRLLKML